jgi:hypothetical protein
MTKQYYQKLAQRESSNNPKAVNPAGFIGLYQMGELALIDAGYYKPDGSKKNDWLGEWTGKNGVNSKEDFLSHPEVQDQAIKEYHSLIWNRYLKDYKKYEGSEINGIIMTKSAMVSCAHLAGQLSMKEFIDSDGKIDKKDGNQVSCSKYMIEFGDYDLYLSEDKKYEGTGDANLINNLFEYFDAPEIQEEDVNNLQRFEILHNKVKSEGEEGLAGIFENLAESHKQVFDFLDNFEQQEDL